MVGQLAELADMRVSQFVRMAVVRYCPSIRQTAADRSAADLVLREVE